MTVNGRDQVRSKICQIDDAPRVAKCCADTSAYISFHRFHRPRRDAYLAEINALYLGADLVPPDLSRDRVAWSLKFTCDIKRHGISAPSFWTHPGSGLVAIWVLDHMPPQARKRWKAAQKVGGRFTVEIALDFE